MYLLCNSRIHVITLDSGHVCVYYASMFRCWHLVWILVRTDHPCLGLRCHTSTMSPQILRQCGAKRLILWILVELLLGHHLNHVLDVWSKSTRSQQVGCDVLDLIHDVLKDVEVHELHGSIQQVPLIMRNDIWIANPRWQGLPHHPVQHEKVREQPIYLERLEAAIRDVQRVISLGIITLPGWSFLWVSSWEDNPRIWAKWDSFTLNLLPFVIHMKILSFLSKKRVE
jgi:hypothetical protein